MQLLPNVKFANDLSTHRHFMIYQNQIVDLSIDQDPIPKSNLTMNFISTVREFLHDPMTKETYRSDPVDFTRDRCFTFPRVCVSILRDHARPAQTRLLHLFQDGAFGENSSCPTACAFFQARQKVNPLFFKEWLQEAADYFYANFSNAGLINTWKGKRLLAIDCSGIHLPDTPETRSKYTVQVNHETGSETVIGLVSFAYDVLNEIPTNACFGKRQAEHNFLRGGHIKQITDDTIYIYDRGYACYPIIATHAVHGGDFVIRCHLTATFKVVEEFVKSDQIDFIVDIKAPATCMVQVNKKMYPKSVRVRLVKIVLSTGEVEILITSLLDRERFTIADLAWLYEKRWGVECGFLRFKQQLEAEAFSSRKVINIQQDLFAMVFLQALETILDKAMDNEIRSKSKQGGLKLEYHVNKSGAYTMLGDHLAGLLLLDNVVMYTHFIAFQNEIKLLKSAIRPGRHEERKRLTATQRLNFWQYNRKRR
jgi:hypothetical protein